MLFTLVLDVSRMVDGRMCCFFSFGLVFFQFGRFIPSLLTAVV